MDGLLEEQQRQKLLIRIALHHMCALFTIIIVALSILFIDRKAYVAWLVLFVIFIVEIIWSAIHLGIKKRSVPDSNINSKGKLLLRYIENNFRLKLKYTKDTKYPRLLLFIEAIVLTFFCTVSGGINSPFFSLFTIFSALGLYVLARRSPILAALDVFVSLLLCGLKVGSENIYLIGILPHKHYREVLP